MIRRFWPFLERTTLHFESLPWSGWQLAAAVAGIVAVRNMLEILVARNPVFEALAALVHYPLAYVAPFVALTLVLAGLAGVLPSRVARLMTLAWLLTLLPPLLDLLLHSAGAEPTIGYLLADPQDLPRIWLRFFDPRTSLVGTTVGIRLETLAAVLLAPVYVLLRSRRWWRALVAMPAVYVASLFFFSLPVLMLGLFRVIGLGTSLEAFYRAEGALIRPDRATSADSLAILWLVPLLLLMVRVWGRMERRGASREQAGPSAGHEELTLGEGSKRRAVPRGWEGFLLGALLSGLAAGLWLYLPFERFTSVAPFDLLAVLGGIIAILLLVGAAGAPDALPGFRAAAVALLGLALVAALGRSVAVGLLAMTGALLPLAAGVVPARLRPVGAGVSLALAGMGAMAAGFALVIGPDALARLPVVVILPALGLGFVFGTWSGSARPWPAGAGSLALGLAAFAAFLSLAGWTGALIAAGLACVAGLPGVWVKEREVGFAWAGPALGLVLIGATVGLVSSEPSKSRLRQAVRCVARLEVIHGERAEERGEWDRARGYYRKALDCDEQEVDALVHLALGFMRYDKDLPKGIRYLERARKRQPDSIAVMSNLGAAYYHEGRLAEARDLLERVCVRDPRNLTALFNLAQVSDELGQRERAIEIYRRFHDLAYGRPEFESDVRRVRKRLKQLTGNKPPRR